MVVFQLGSGALLRLSRANNGQEPKLPNNKSTQVTCHIRAAMANCRALAVFAAAALIFTVAAQYQQTGTVRAYATSFRGVTFGNEAATSSVHFKTFKSKIDIVVDKRYPSGGLVESSQRHGIVHNDAQTNLSNETAVVDESF